MLTILMESSGYKPPEQVIQQALVRAEFFYPGPPTISNVLDTIARGASDTAALKRLLEITVQVSREVPAPPFKAPFDDDLDALLRARGWASRRQESWESHMYDLWTWPGTRHFAQPTSLQHEGQRLRLFYAAPTLRSRAPHTTWANSSELCQHLDDIESWPWTPK